jgi:hypothetical protein
MTHQSRLSGHNPFALLPPSRRLIQAARRAGVTGGKREIDGDYSL